MGDTAARHLPPDRANLLACACIAAIAVCCGFAGALFPTAPEISGALLVIGLCLIALMFIQLKLVLSTTAKLQHDLAGAEQAIALGRTAQGRLESLIDSLSDGFVLWDNEGRLTLHNPRGSLSNAPEITAGMTFDSYILHDYSRLDIRTTGGNPEAWLETRRQWFGEADSSHEILLKSGAWMMLTERRTNDGSTVSIYTDITERKCAEERREVSERRLAHAQKLARLGIFEWDAAGSDMYWSDIMYDIVGLSPDSPPLDFSQYLLLVRAESRDLVRSTFRRRLTTGGKYNQEYEIVRPDGQIRAVRAEAEAVMNDQGEVVRILGSVHDQTGAKRVETALRRAKEVAVEANKAKSEFLANVSHELRTPLNAIIGFSEVMIQEVFGPVGNDRYRDYAGDIRQSGIHLLGVINDLLDYSKLEAGRLELHLEEICVRRIIDKCIRMMRQGAESENVALVGKLPEIDDLLHGDEQKVTQIVLNLLSNAIKFTPAGGVVTVSMHETDSGIDIEVTDTGIGMSSSDIELALSPFGQVDSALNRRHAGTGLGLPLSKSLAELHGGTLKITSAPGAGTTVTVHLSRQALNTGTPPDLRLVMGGQAG